MIGRSFARTDNLERIQSAALCTAITVVSPAPRPRSGAPLQVIYEQGPPGPPGPAGKDGVDGTPGAPGESRPPAHQPANDSDESTNPDQPSLNRFANQPARCPASGDLPAPARLPSALPRRSHGGLCPAPSPRAALPRPGVHRPLPLPPRPPDPRPFGGTRPPGLPGALSSRVWSLSESLGETRSPAPGSHRAGAQGPRCCASPFPAPG